MTPYRTSAEPEPEVLWSARVARLGRRRSTALLGTIGGSLGATALAVALGLPAVGSVFFAVFFGAALVAAGKAWGFDRRLELRIERVGAAHRLRVTGTAIAVRAPFVVTGSSRLDEAGYLLMQLVVAAEDGRRTTIEAVGESIHAAPPRDEWFGGSQLDAAAPAGEFIVDHPRRLMSLRDMLASFR